MKYNYLVIAVLAAFAGGANAGTVVVAPSDAPPEARAKADLVCDGKDDQVELLKSITKAPRISTVFERNPNTLLPVKCYGAHSVEWLPGDYYLSKTLTVPDAEGMVIDAEGARFHYQPKDGDAVVVQGMSQCRYRFGTILTHSTGAALRQDRHELVLVQLHQNVQHLHLGAAQWHRRRSLVCEHRCKHPELRCNANRCVIRQVVRNYGNHGLVCQTAGREQQDQVYHS